MAYTVTALEKIEFRPRVGPVQTPAEVMQEIDRMIARVQGAVSADEHGPDLASRLAVMQGEAMLRTLLWARAAVAPLAPPRLISRDGN